MISLQTVGYMTLNWTLWIYLFPSSDIFSLIVSKLQGFTRRRALWLTKSWQSWSSNLPNLSQSARLTLRTKQADHQRSWKATCTIRVKDHKSSFVTDHVASNWVLNVEFLCLLIQETSAWSSWMWQRCFKITVKEDEHEVRQSPAHYTIRSRLYLLNHYIERDSRQRRMRF